MVTGTSTVGARAEASAGAGGVDVVVGAASSVVATVVAAWSDVERERGCLGGRAGRCEVGVRGGRQVPDAHRPRGGDGRGGTCAEAGRGLPGSSAASPTSAVAARSMASGSVNGYFVAHPGNVLGEFYLGPRHVRGRRAQRAGARRRGRRPGRRDRTGSRRRGRPRGRGPGRQPPLPHRAHRPGARGRAARRAHDRRRRRRRLRPGRERGAGPPLPVRVAGHSQGGAGGRSRHEGRHPGYR
jgi:hypothetical protein